MGEIGHIYIFGDETFDYGKHLHHLVHQQDDPLVRAFTENVYYALRAEIGRLPQRQQQEFGRFASFAELTAQRLDGPIHPALDQALSCAYHLARFIRCETEICYSLQDVLTNLQQVWPRMVLSKSRQFLCHWHMLRSFGCRRGLLLNHVL